MGEYIVNIISGLHVMINIKYSGVNCPTLVLFIIPQFVAAFHSIYTFPPPSVMGWLLQNIYLSVRTHTNN